MALAVLISVFGGLSSTILTVSRIYLPMAEDGVFFRSLARIHPTYRTPNASLVAQGAWSAALALLGTFEQLLDYGVVALFLFHAATGLALFRLRRTRPGAARPYRVWGYPWVPAGFVLTSLLFVINSLVASPADSVIGLGLVALGLPAYVWWRRTARADVAAHAPSVSGQESRDRSC
jgi:APA family basic amino acid/polyamine antiporter